MVVKQSKMISSFSWPILRCNGVFESGARIKGSVRNYCMRIGDLAENPNDFIARIRYCESGKARAPYPISSSPPC